MLREAVAIDDQCALAWEAIAVASVNWTMSGFAKAGAAARRALELNDTLPGAWTVLAEIAEEEKRWTDSEEYFLRALYADPTNAHANEMYGESLLARGRIKEGLRYALEAYRYEPASVAVNWHTAFAAKMAGDPELGLKHVLIMAELQGNPDHPFLLDSMAEIYLAKGETEQAVETYLEMGERIAPWFPDCVRARDNPGAHARLDDAVRATFAQHNAGELNETQEWWWIWNMLRCGTWIGETDVVFGLLLEDDVPTEGVFLPLFHPDAGVLRQDPRFQELVTESGLLEYWRKWGWSDYCEPDGESFRCD